MGIYQGKEAKVPGRLGRAPEPQQESNVTVLPPGAKPYRECLSRDDLTSPDRRSGWLYQCEPGNNEGGFLETHLWMLLSLCKQHGGVLNTASAAQPTSRPGLWLPSHKLVQGIA